MGMIIMTKSQAYSDGDDDDDHGQISRMPIPVTDKIRSQITEVFFLLLL